MNTSLLLEHLIVVALSVLFIPYPVIAEIGPLSKGEVASEAELIITESVQAIKRSLDSHAGETG